MWRAVRSTETTSKTRRASSSDGAVSARAQLRLLRRSQNAHWERIEYGAIDTDAFNNISVGSDGRPDVA